MRPSRHSTVLGARAMRALAAVVLATLAAGTVEGPDRRELTSAAREGTGIAEAAPVAASVPAQEPGDPALELVDQTTWVAQDGAFVVTVRPEDLPAGATVSLEVRSALTSRHDFGESVEGVLGGGTLGRPVSAVPVAELQDAEGNVTLSFDPATLGLAAGDYGVYPVQVTVDDEAGGPVASLLTYLLRLPPDGWFPSGQLSVAVVTEVGAGPALQPDGSYEVPPESLAATRDRVDMLREADVPLTVAPVPETLDALETARPQLLADLVQAVQGDEVLARPYVDIDLDVLSRANLVTEAPPEADAGARVVRERFGLEPEPNIWLTGPTVSRTEATTWSQLGVTHAILPPSALAEEPDPDQSIRPVVQLPGGTPAFVSDEALVDRLLEVDDRLAAQQFAAELGMIWAERPAEPRAVVLRVPPDRPFDPTLVAEALGLLGDPAAPVTPVTAGSLVQTHGTADEDVDAPLADKGPTEDLRWMTSRMDTARRTIAGLSDAIADPGLTTSLTRSLLVAPGVGVEPAARRAHLRRVEGAATGVANGVSAPETFRITLTAREGTIPLTLTNDLDQPVDVQVRLHSNQLEFLDGAVFDVTIPPEGTRVDLRVRTRTSGAFPLEITLLSPDGNVVFDETTFNVRSTAISGVGLVLSVGAVLVLIVWWARHWRQARRPRQPVAAG